MRAYLKKNTLLSCLAITTTTSTTTTTTPAPTTTPIPTTQKPTLPPLTTQKLQTDKSRLTDEIAGWE